RTLRLAGDRSKWCHGHSTDVIDRGPVRLTPRPPAGPMNGGRVARRAPATGGRPLAATELVDRDEEAVVDRGAVDVRGQHDRDLRAHRALPELAERDVGGHRAVERVHRR